MAPGVIVPASNLQVLDEHPPIGECAYSVYATTDRGMGIFYFSEAFRMLATALCTRPSENLRVLFLAYKSTVNLFLEKP